MGFMVGFSLSSLLLLVRAFSSKGTTGWTNKFLQNKSEGAEQPSLPPESSEPTEEVKPHCDNKP